MKRMKIMAATLCAVTILALPVKATDESVKSKVKDLEGLINEERDAQQHELLALLSAKTPKEFGKLVAMTTVEDRIARIKPSETTSGRIKSLKEEIADLTTRAVNNRKHLEEIAEDARLRGFGNTADLAKDFAKNARNIEEMIGDLRRQVIELEEREETLMKRARDSFKAVGYFLDACNDVQKMFGTSAGFNEYVMRAPDLRKLAESINFN